MKPFHFIAFIALLLPFTAQASYSYSWFEVGYIADAKQQTVAGKSESADGVDFRLNFLAGENLYITGYIDEVAVDNDSDVDRFGVGFGLHNDFSADIGIYATLTYEDIESSFKDDDGLGITAGVRYNVQEDFEAFGGIKYARYEDMDGRFLHIGGVWAFSQNYAVVGEYTTGDFTLDGFADELDRDDVRLALRVQF